MPIAPMTPDDELVLATVRSAAGDIARGLAHFEAKSATHAVRLAATHALASAAISHAEAALGLPPGHITPYDGTNKPPA